MVINPNAIPNQTKDAHLSCLIVCLENHTLGLKSFFDGFNRATSRQGFAAVLGNVGPILATTGVAFAGTFRNEIANLASK